MSSIKAVTTVVPENKFNKDSVIEAAKSWLENDVNKQNTFARFVESSSTQNRYFCIPLNQILTLSGQSQRAEIYLEMGTSLISQAIIKLLSKTGLEARDIDCVVTTSCTAPIIPSLDITFLQKLNFRSNVTRVPIYQYGCGGGVAGLALASNLAQTGKRTLLCSVELCSLVFHKDNQNPAQLVGGAIFSDGAACVLVEPDNRGIAFIGAQSELLPNTQHIMGYDQRDTGAHLILDKQLPQTIAEQAPKIVHSFLTEHSLHPADISWWLLHPGGKRVIDSLQIALKLENEQCYWAKDVLTSYGNMSSASVLFVLSEFLKCKVAKTDDYAMVLGMGPGMMIEMALFKFTNNK
jgi:alkylresorcinol/alkylpyrone synthase